MAEGDEISILKRSLYSPVCWGIIHHSYEVDVNRVNGEEWLRKEKCVCECEWCVSVSVCECECVSVSVCVDKQMLSSHKKDILPFATTWMDLNHMC